MTTEATEMTTKPAKYLVTSDDGVDPYDIEDNKRQGRAWSDERVPSRFPAATVNQPEVAQWCERLIGHAASAKHRGHPVIRTGPSLLLLGNVGTGKTHEAYAALRVLSLSGAICKWRAVLASDYLRIVGPRNGVDTEREFEAYAGAHVLLLDDLGSHLGTPWSESELLRLIDRRYAHLRPTLITSNIKRAEFVATVGTRIASRLNEMCTIATMIGDDRRCQP